MEKLEKYSTKVWLSVLLLFCIPAVWALFVPGFYGASDDLHIAWLYELDKTVNLGQFPPRFVPDLSFGFGYPLFNFVFPLPFYIGEIFHLLGLSLVDSIKTVFFLSIPFSAIFMFLLLKQLTAKSWAFIGSMLYIYAPYRAVDIYIRGAIGEIVSFVFLPLIILSLIKLEKSRKWLWVGIGSMSLASLLLSHNISAYMFLPFVGLLGIMLFFSIRNEQVLGFANKKVFLAKIILLIFIGLLISSYFWLPALLESNLMKYDTVFNFADHFPTIRQLIKPYWGYGASVPGPGDGMSFFLGSANLLVLGIASIFFITAWKKISKPRRLIIFWALAGLTLTFFLMNHRSAFIWNNLPLLPYFQFPWRFLILTTFFIPLLVIILDKFKYQRLLKFVILISIFPAWIFFRPEHFLARFDDYYLNRYIPIPSASQEYLKTQEEYLRLPKATDKRPDKNFPLLFPTDGITNIKKDDDLKVNFKYISDQDRLISLNKYYFPGWQAKIDGKSAEVLAGQPYGQVSINVPAGIHQVEISFKETKLRSLLNFASLVGFLVSLMMVLI